MFFNFLVLESFVLFTPRFNPDSAFYFLRAQMDFGYRIPGTSGHEKCEEFLYKTLEKFADSVFKQVFYRENVQFTNIIGYFKGGKKRILLGAHYDTRPFCERDPNPAMREKPLPGANDGASGVAVLLEIARIISKKRPKKDVYIVFFDGEDYGLSDEDMFIGSKYLASSEILEVDEVIVLDMIGDKDLNVYKEGFSEEFSKTLNDKLFGILVRMFPENFYDSVKYHINDDHMPFLRMGIPAVVLIDFDYPYWHTHMDTEDKCSKESLKKVGDGILYYLFHR